MNRCLVFGSFLILCGTAHAGAIYKWADESGKVHYGDKIEGAKAGASPTILSVPADPPAVERPGAPASQGSRGIAAKPVPTEPGSQQACLAMARTMVDKHNSTPAEIRADSKKLLDLCPGTAYECVTYIERPEANRCKAVPMKPNGHITTNNTYTR